MAFGIISIVSHSIELECERINALAEPVLRNFKLRRDLVSIESTWNKYNMLKVWVNVFGL